MAIHLFACGLCSRKLSQSVIKTRIQGEMDQADIQTDSILGKMEACMSLDLFKAKDNPIRFQCLLRLVELEILHFKVGNRHRSRPSGGKSMAL